MREAQKIGNEEKGEEKKRREKMCIEVFSFSNGSSLSTPSLQLTSLPTTSPHERRRRRRSPPARPIRPRRAILYEGPFWAAIAAQKGPEYN